MAGLSSPGRGAELRARRWDAVVLGSGVSGLVAAARLGMANLRVLVVEEEAAAQAFPGLREPFLLSGARDGGAVDACMRALTLPLIERRRVLPDRIAYQVVGPDLRLDVGESDLTADELVAWGLAKPDEARRIVRLLVEAAEAERDQLLSAPIVRVGRGLARTLARAAPGRSPGRGLPSEAASPPPGLAPILAAQVRALSGFARQEPPPEVRARLLGAPLAGGAGFADGPPWLVGLLRRRVESRYGEFRELRGDFRLVSAEGQPGIAPEGSKELWLGRALVVAAPAAGLASVLDPAERPDFLEPPPAGARRRRSLHLRIRRDLLPEAMAPRVIALGDAAGSEPITLSRFANRERPEVADLVATALAEPDDPAGAGDERVLERVSALLPFCAADWERVPTRAPRWDDDGWLEDGPPGAGWPEEIELRVSSRPPVYRLDRAGMAGLGLEGDLLLGWRAGDAIAAELA
jgi:hypothetical protein